jgi:mono/diheme cytochrome c family protein
VLMPAWGDTLSDDEIHDMVLYLRTLCKCKFGS